METSTNFSSIDAESQAIMNEIVNLVENDIPECRQTLRDNHKNLEAVAEYCDTNYLRSNNMSMALEETKNYATQSLASVAYQIASLAFNVLHLLDFQVNQITDLGSSVDHLVQAEAIHAEKVARREIGLFAVNKKPNRFLKIIPPQNPERPQKYIRKPIDYSIYDDIGHGVRLYSSNQPDWIPKNYIEKVIALYDYTKEKPDELNLVENAIIYVTKKNEDGWYEGVLDGQEGLFPCNYVEPIDDIQ